MIFFPFFKHNTWITTLATHGSAVATSENASLMDKGIQNRLICTMKEADTPKILYSNQNVENLYLVEPESSTAVKGARQNTLDIYITGLKMRYKSILKYIYGISFPSLVWKIVVYMHIHRSTESVLTTQQPLQSQKNFHEYMSITGECKISVPSLFI
jgi:hypothetical protein